MTYCLDIQNLSVTRDDTRILDGVSLQLPEGNIHAILGPNGAGKSTFFYALIGQPSCQVTSEKALYKGQNLFDLSVEERARAGIFLSFQTPIEIPGLSSLAFLKEINQAMREANGQEKTSPTEFLKKVRALSQAVGLSEEFLKRPLNVGFSGGEKKRFEMLQILLLKPKLVLLDEIDSGLDMDALKTMNQHIQNLCQEGVSFLIISHYRHFLESVEPRVIHIFSKGSLKLSTSDFSLVKKIEADGYDSII